MPKLTPKVVLIGLILVLLSATGLPLLPFDQWWIRALDFPRRQIAITGIVLLVSYLYYFLHSHHRCEWFLLGLLLLAVGYQWVKILPYTALMPKQVMTAEAGPSNATLSLLVANVMMENRAVEDYLGVVRSFDPDVIVTMEADAWWEQALRPLDEAYPHSLKLPLDNTYGMLVHSRLALIDPEIRFIIKDSIPSMHMQVALPSRERVFMHFVHPDPPIPTYATETTKRDAELLIVGREAGGRDQPTIIAGDFNDVPWSRNTTLFQKASGLLDPRIGRGLYSTYNARMPFLRWPLDHVFHSSHFTLVRIEVGPDFGSDHFPIFIELRLLSDEAFVQDGEATSPEENRQIDEKIDEGRQQAQ